ncbi:MAG: DUF1453 family protein [Alicyclobacillaceae bacterium]|uniref:CcdC protein domain-containing protein n=1 Tax=Alicyclobacillus sp. SP_1 TaxID=2942475 RepID=UPI00215891E8|nr:CcdC protein domain-containing protein [Alicyclobacillus sp. SP_1]MCY0887705.1 DUF1453 family protein [Alicyclobacillaceae bacterium]MCY0895428.1 DUF1453 family protein [Alicyclobacillaceae bacterium]
MPIFILIALFVFVMYRRARRTLTYQPVRRTQMITRIVLFGVIGVFLLTGIAASPMYILYVLIGLVVGGALAYLAMRTSRFEKRESGWYYRANPWVGLVVVTVFLLRFAYDYYTIYQQMAAADAAAGRNAAVSHLQATYSNSPLTFILLYVVVAYYLVYYVMVLLHERRLERQGATH